MVVFLADRTNLQTKRLHNTIKNKLQSAGLFSQVQRQRADPRDPGQFRVTGETNPQVLFDDGSYPVTTGRIEIGVNLDTADPYEYYWINWIEPERNLLVGWHQDDTHPDLGPVHIQVNSHSTPVDRDAGRFIDSHPIDVVEHRLADLPAAVAAVDWDAGEPVGLQPSASVIVDPDQHE